MRDFYIKAVYILNFRGYSGAKEYNFVDKNGNPYNIVLLSGPNGYGKTTLLDSIEWCLTGNIKRVIDDYNNRCSIKSEKTVSSHKGLIRNINATNKDVIVRVEMGYKNENIKIYRKFNGTNELEAFNISLTEFNIECSDNIRDEVEKVIKHIETDFTFNNICSYDKNIELYKKGRNDIYNFFEAYYSEFYEAKKIIENLEKLKKSLLDIKESKKEKINRLNGELNFKKELLNTVNSIDNIKIRKYPEDKLFNGEIYIDDSIINDKVDITKDFISYNKSNNLNFEINKLNDAIKNCNIDVKNIGSELKKVTNLIKLINKEKTESEKKENERISKPLNDIYKKITRNTSIKEINLKKDNAKNKSSLDIKDIEGNDTPFANIMSTEQVSTLAISMYLAKALLNRNSSFKVYLMDDPIQTMDDLNILSLIDLLRFQFMEDEEDRIMNQLFIPN